MNRLRAAGGLTLVVCCVLALGSPPASAAQLGAGNQPNAVVDRDGTTHVVWNENRSLQASVLHYCRIPRGSDACADQRTFIPRPERTNNTEFNAPRVGLSPFGDVVLMTNRCCGTNPPATQPENFVWVSEDDGATFTGPQVIGRYHSTSTAGWVFDPVDRRIVAIEGHTLYARVSGQPLGQTTTANAELTTQTPYSATIAQRGRGSFVAAWSTLGGTAYVRTFDRPAGPLSAINVAANWTPPVAVPDAEETQLVSGPVGTFLVYRQVSDRRMMARRVDGATIGGGFPLTDRAAGAYARFIQAPDGRLHALYTTDAALRYSTSVDGANWTPPHAVTGPDPNIRHQALAAAQVDAGPVGLAVWEDLRGGLGNPTLLSATLPSPSDAGVPPAGPVTPPAPVPDSSGSGPPPAQPCQLFTLGPLDVIADACFTVRGSAYTARGSLRINGLRVTLDGSITFNRSARTVKSSGAVTVRAGDTLLWRGPIDWRIPAGNTFEVGTVDVGKLGGKLLGFPLAGQAKVVLRRGAAEIPLNVGLPSIFGGVTGALTLRVDNLGGVRLRELNVRVGNAFLGPLQVQNLTFRYEADENVWQGGAKLILPPQPPGPSLESQIGFREGDLDYLRNELTLPGPGVAIGPAVFLTKIRFSLETRPDLKIGGGVSVAAGPQLGSVRLIGVDGDFAFTFPRSAPAIFRIDGRLSVAQIALARAFFEFRTNGYVAFGGGVDLDVAVASVKADFSGAMLGTRFNLEAGADICLGSGAFRACAGGRAVISSRGFAGCASIVGLSGGAGYVWGQSLTLFSGCDVGPYRATVAQGGTSPQFAVRNGTRGVFIGVRGQGGAPHVALVGPGGRRLEPPADGPARQADWMSVREGDTTWFVVRAPAAGRWQVEPLPGSVPVAGLRRADALPRPQVRASVRRARGGQRELRYRVTPLAGQRVWFAEHGRAAAGRIGDARGRSGTLRFRPADGPGGTRRIVAVVEQGGMPRTELNVARYVAPPPRRLAAPGRLRARRSGTRLVVTWRPSTGAARYLVRVRLSDGRRLLLPATRGRRRVTVPGLTRASTARISVVAVKTDGQEGRTARAALRAARRR